MKIKAGDMDNAHLLTPFMMNWLCIIEAKKNNY